MGQYDSEEPQGHIQDLEERLAEEQKKAQDYLRRLKYLQADFENYRKRTERQVKELTDRCNEKLVAEILCFIDDLERALDYGRESADGSALLKGVEMIHQNLTRMLEKEGLERIDAVGKVFDPKLHELAVKIPRSDCEEGLVLEEIRKGFVYKGRVLRPCMVNISCLDEEQKNNE
ncbi:nucleotide exchange factor GrpE [Candidatus Bathyarchaeota archaeon]|nr:nucleotide exchange factor GrpE [Candidatus Bathyarchaeota archaeon]